MYYFVQNFFFKRTVKPEFNSTIYHSTTVKMSTSKDLTSLSNITDTTPRVWYNFTSLLFPGTSHE